MSTETSTRSDRTTCDECGLSYYADENDACPYCRRASDSTGSESAPTDPQAEPAKTTARDEDGGESSLLRRLSNRVRAMIGEA